MDSIRKEIEAEIKRARLDKGRLYDILLSIIDTSADQMRGPQGPAGVCKCTCPCSNEGKTATKKTAIKKKTTASST